MAKTPPHKVVMTEGKEEIIKALLSEYDIQSVQDIQEAQKDLPGGTIKKMMEVEMENHLGYEKYEGTLQTQMQQKTSCGDFNPKHFLGRLFRRETTVSK